MTYRKTSVFLIIFTMSVLTPIWVSFLIFFLSLYTIQCNYSKLWFYSHARRAMYWLMVERFLQDKVVETMSVMAYPMLVRLRFERKWFVDKYVELGATKEYFAAVADYLGKPRELTPEEIEIQALQNECNELEEELFGFGMPDKKEEDDLDETLRDAGIKRPD